MATPTITDYLKYANLQMAAEAFLVRIDGAVREDIVAALMDGNKHASRFTKTEAEKFASTEGSQALRGQSTEGSKH